MGTGTGDIIRLCTASGLTKIPEFIQDENFKTIIWRNNVTEAPTKQDDDVDSVTNNQIKILQLIQQNERITTNKLAIQLHISQRKIKENIAKLKEKEKEILSRMGSSKTGYWKINTIPE
jgi:ATP-dependent DNA helicase RecG